MPLEERRMSLDELMLEGTPADVAVRYRTLAKRAKSASFGLLVDDIVMLDTETTGLSYRKNDLIEIAAARINGGVVVQRFNTYVHPTGPIPAEIQVLTGITDLDVCNAPMPVEAVAALAEFVGGLPVVAHNATFDRTFVESVEGGSDVSDTWIDSLVLSRIALPRLRSHRLAHMASAFGCDPVTHRAMADVDALCGMWPILLVALQDLPRGFLGQLADMHEEVNWAYRPLFAHLAAQDAGARFSLRDTRHDLVAAATGHRRRDAMDDSNKTGAQASSIGGVDPELMTQAFASDGPVASMYGSYERRPEQVCMAREVCVAQAESTHRAIEAGTGVGKSVAYLLPSVLFAQRNDVTVGVATKTNALTDQLMSHELPALDAVLPGGVTYCSIKGYDHYPCLHRVDLARTRELAPVDDSDDGWTGHDNATDMLDAIATVLAYACQSPEGDVDALGIRWRAVPRSSLTTTPSECLRSRCPYYPMECFVHGARRRAACSDVVVTNHSMLLRDIALDNAILPPIRHWVVDEAHSFEQEARRQWAEELGADVANRTFLSLGDVGSGTIHSLMTRAAHLDAATLVTSLLAKASSVVQRARVATADLLVGVHELMPLAGPNGGYDGVTLWIDDGVRASDEWAAVERFSATAVGALDAAAKAVGEARDALAAEDAQMGAELSDAATSLQSLCRVVSLIVLEPQDGYVYSAELYRAKRRMGMERLVAERLDVGAEFATSWYPNVLSVIYTSATMAVGRSFDHFEHSVGLDLLDVESRHCLSLDSSFDYDAHMAVLVARDLPMPNDRAYLGSLEDLLFDIHHAMDGSVLTLFTNRREMELVFRSLRPRLAREGLELACQERTSSPRRLRERFMDEEKLSLFALRSFWEGFDAAGSTLRCVVIPKLPFASPRDPLVRERELREQRAWWRYSLPEAVLAVKQAAGRLIRTDSDTGILVMADSRIATKRYGKTFTDALPSKNVSLLETRNVGTYIRTWRTWHER